ncbi:MAG: type II toxin-antitoxin system VapC family toxin [Cyclobacteriaceae bacterium]
MKYLLDTNICIYFFRGKYDLKNRINTAGIENCAISEITLAELVYGAEHSSNPKKNHGLIADLTEQIATISIFDSILEYAQQKSRLRKLGTLISDFDLLIGSTAIANGLTMVTHNTGEFERLVGIELENWISG